MRILCFVLAMVLSVGAYPQNKIQALTDYCRKVRIGYVENDIELLETAISGYYPASRSTKAEFFYNGTELDLAAWEDGIQIKGCMSNNNTNDCKFFDPCSVDTYIASIKGEVAINEIPLLRAAPYDFLYTNFIIGQMSKVEIKASCLGENHLLVTSDSTVPLSISIKCNQAKYNDKGILDSDHPTEVFSWECEKESNFVLVIENHGETPVSVFLAKD